MDRRTMVPANECSQLHIILNLLEPQAPSATIKKRKAPALHQQPGARHINTQSTRDMQHQLTTEEASVACQIEYRNIDSFPGYRVGSDGSVWSCWARVYTPGVKGCRYALGTIWRRLKPDSSGTYLTVALSRKTRHVHRLVLEAFVGPCPHGMEACHFPSRDTNNNAVSNLRWDTHIENVSHKVLHGTHLRGLRNPKCKLTPQQVRAIRIIYEAGGVQQSDIAALYGVTRQLIWRIIKRKCWAHLE